jgi:hypothetical protein
MRLCGEGVVLSLEPEHHCLEIGDAPAKSLIFFDEANVVAAHISKESLGHECFLQETPVIAQFVGIVDPGVWLVRARQTRRDSAKDSLLL